MALYSGIVRVNADGTAQVNFDIPAFAGTARVMAVAWSKDKVGATAVIQPGGSLRDKEVIEAADEKGLAMVFTGMRHFRH